MKIMIIAHFTSAEEKGNCRFDFLARLLQEQGHQVELVTSSFSHFRKMQRKREMVYPYKVTYIHESGYSKNLSIKRIISHRKTGKALREYLDGKMERPDIVYCSVPSLDMSYEAGRYAEKNHIRFIIDVQDLWPEAFEMVMPIQVISKFILMPMRKKADRIYGMADEIVAVSETYVNRALSVNCKTKNGCSVFLGTELSRFDSLVEEGENQNFDDDIFQIAYIGTIGHSYNIKLVIDAIKQLEMEGINNLRFLVMGDGPLLLECQKYAKRKKVSVVFTGRLPYDEMVQKLKLCQAAVNPITHGAASVINKVGDYAAAGLPVINSQDSPEYRKLLQEYKAGINCKCDDLGEVTKAIKMIFEDASLRSILGKNNRKMAEEKFNREKTYGKIVKLIECKE